MKRMTCSIVGVLTGSALMLAGAGCQDNPKMQSQTASANGGAVTDMATPIPAQSGPDITPMAIAPGIAAVQPVSYDPPGASAGVGGPGAVTSTTVVTTTTPTGAAGGHYRVKHGDTLYSIAKTHYGDGKQWQRIAAANPGLSPTTLKVGQTISLPM